MSWDWDCDWRCDRSIGSCNVDERKGNIHRGSKLRSPRSHVHFERVTSLHPLLTLSLNQVKPNVGHSEGASGITSIIKAILSLEHKTIPPNIHFNTPNPKIPFADGKLHVPLEPTPWPDHRPQRISVNSFGIGGSNAHVILESASTIISKPIPVSVDCRHDPQLLVVSAHTADTLRKRIRQVTAYTKTHPDRLCDLAHTLGCRREHLAHRAFAVVQPSTPALEETAFTSFNTTAPNVTFVFTGQGAQWPGMGKGLLNNFPKFKQAIKAMDEALQQLHDYPSWLLYGKATISLNDETSEANILTRTSSR